MTWTPTKGQKQADGIVQQLCGAAPGVGATTTPLFAWHMMDVIAKAIDDAYVDGTFSGIEAAGDGMPAWPKRPDGTVDVGATITTALGGGLGAYSAHFTNGNGHASPNPDDYSELPTYKGAPVVYDRIDDPHVIPLDDHMPDYSPAEVAEAQASILTTLAEPIPEAPKKRRGRPPGAKAKAKPAKKRKSAKAIRAELYPVEGPVAETVAPVAATVTEAPAEAHADSP